MAVASVAMVSEGSYPHSHGGVSVWCDQLVRGLPDFRFDLVSITGSSSAQPVWELPVNVGTVRAIPLWGPPPRERRLSREEGVRLEAAAFGLVDAIVEPSQDVARALFLAALREITHQPRRAALEQVLVSKRVVRRLLARWRTQPDFGVEGGHASPVIGTVGDAISALQLLAHSLRPLWFEPPKTDVVHCVANGVAGLVGLAAKWEHGTPYVLSEHGVYLRERYLAFRHAPYSWTVKWFLLRFYRYLTGLVYTEAELIAPGNVYNRRWEVRNGADPESVQTVYNGVDPDQFSFIPAEPEVPTLSWVGRIDPLKDLDTLVRSFAIVHDKAPTSRLRIFGATPRGNERYHQGIVDLAKLLRVTSSVAFEGRVESVRDAYAAGNVIMLTSISEGVPYTLMEAMSSGRATVSTDVGGVAEAVGTAGIVVPPRDPAAVASASLRLIDDAGLRRSLGQAARGRVMQLFTVDRTVDTFRTIYGQVAATHVGVPPAMAPSA